MQITRTDKVKYFLKIMIDVRKICDIIVLVYVNMHTYAIRKTQSVIVTRKGLKGGQGVRCQT